VTRPVVAGIPADGHILTRPVEVQQTSLTFGVTGGEASWSFCNPTFHDWNGDGLLDLRCHFRMSDAGFTQAGQFGIPRGRTINPIEFEGGD